MIIARRDFITRTFDILRTHQFNTSWPVGHYDGGMNFLGVLGEVDIHQIKNRHVTLYFEWLGDVSEPSVKPPPMIENYNFQPNILYDFNGSGNHFENNDPRYLLPIGSSGLILKHIQIDNEERLLNFWIIRNGTFWNKLLFIPLIQSYLLSKAWHEIFKINQYLRENKFQVNIVHNPTPESDI